jgi:DNA-binding NarL/FixJ family response regulator
MAAEASADHARQVLWLDINDAVLRLALKHVTVDAGLIPVSNAADSGLWVTDRLPQRSVSVDILVVHPTPLGGRIALGAMFIGATRTLISAAKPKDLPGAATCLAQGISTVPCDVLDVARRLPDLTPRQCQILTCLAGGCVRDTAVAERISVSPATVKREIQALFEKLTAPGRQDLGERARCLGFGPPLSTLELSLVSATTSQITTSWDDAVRSAPLPRNVRAITTP